MPYKHHILVGMGGWDLPPFEGTFYPASKKRGFRKLEFYSRFFDFVELNSSFYKSSFMPSQIRRWLADVRENERFVFAVKLFKGFTHDRSATDRDTVAVLRLLEMLQSAGRFAGLLVQFPYSFNNTEEHRGHLIDVCRLFAGYEIFVEVRHDSWNTPSIVGMMHQAGARPVNVDLPRIKRHIPLTDHTADGIAYFRMMGRNSDTWDQPWRIDQSGRYLVSDRYHYEYSIEELLDLSRRISAAEMHRSKTLIVFHNDVAARSLFNALQLQHIFKPGEKLCVPAQLLRFIPSLAEFCDIPSPHQMSFPGQ